MKGENQSGKESLNGSHWWHCFFEEARPAMHEPPVLNNADTLRRASLNLLTEHQHQD